MDHETAHRAARSRGRDTPPPTARCRRCRGSAVAMEMGCSPASQIRSEDRLPVSDYNDQIVNVHRAIAIGIGETRVKSRRERARSPRGDNRYQVIDVYLTVARNIAGNYLHSCGVRLPGGD